MENFENMFGSYMDGCQEKSFLVSRLNEILFSVGEYMSWLVNFTDKVETFTDDMFVMSDLDNKNICNLKLLFNMVDEYAVRNHVKTNQEFINEDDLTDKKAYLIRYGNIGFVLEAINDYDSIIYKCTRTDIINNSINYIDLVNDEVENRTKSIKIFCK